jgi:hypothetical protein
VGSGVRASVDLVEGVGGRRCLLAGPACEAQSLWVAGAFASCRVRIQRQVELGVRAASLLEAVL